MSINIEETYYPDGPLQFRLYYYNDKIHRDDGPAFQEFLSNGTVVVSAWRKHGARHRLDGPAHETFYQSGKIKSRTWYIDGRAHRADGPAEELFFEDGRHKQVLYYLDGCFLSREEHQRRVSLSKLSTDLTVNRGVAL